MSSEISLSPTQQRIVEFKDGAILVKAGAGSGKTRVLTERVRSLLKITKRKILALTFTNKAGEEITERLKNIPDIKKRMFVGTFHSFCQSILESHGHLIGLKEMPHIFDKEVDRLELIEDAINQTPSLSRDYNRCPAKKQHELRYDILSFISRVKRELLTPEEVIEENNDEDDLLLYQSYQDLLFAHNAIDFDDLLLLTYQLFINNPKVASLYRRSFEYICVDEAQDLNNAQYALLKALTSGEHKNIMMVGDPDQSIYAFNGSSHRFMESDFVNDYSAEIVVLKENYRSSKSVLRVAEQVITSEVDIDNTPIDGETILEPYRDEREEAHAIVKRILRMYGNDVKGIEGKVSYEKIVILARNKYIFKHLEEELEKHKIPFFYKMSPGAVQFESNLMRLLYLSFKVKLNPMDNLHLRELKKNLKVSVQIGSLKDFLKIVNDENQLQILNTVFQLSDDGGNLRRLITDLKAVLEINDDNEKQLFFNDVDSFLSHWKNYANKTDRKSLLQFRNSLALGRTHTLTRHKGVTLSTVHSMKGQEFDIVFVMGLDNETFPDYRAVRAGGVELKQEKNNLYVAITRAKRCLYMSWPESRLMPWGDTKRRSISMFLRNVEV